jgi:hypothetical protein
MKALLPALWGPSYTHMYLSPPDVTLQVLLCSLPSHFSYVVMTTVKGASAGGTEPSIHDHVTVFEHPSKPPSDSQVAMLAFPCLP